MADNDVQITFGANTSALNSGIASARAQLAGFQADTQRIAQTMISSGRTTDEVYVGALAHARSEAAALSGVLKTAGVDIAGTGAHALSAGAGLGFYAREARAMADELASGRFRNFDGTLINFAVHGAQSAAAFAAANPIVTAFGAAVLAAGAAIAYFTIQEIQAATATSRLTQQAALFGGVKLPAEQIQAYRTSIINVGGATAEFAEKAISAFQNMRGATSASVGAMVSDFNILVKAGEEPEAAIKKLAAAFSGALDPSLKGINELIPNLTAEQLSYIDAAQKTGSITAAQAAVQRAFSDNARDIADAAIKRNNDMIESAKQLMEANNAAAAAGVPTLTGEDPNVSLQAQIDHWTQINEQIRKAQEGVKGYSDTLAKTPQTYDQIIAKGREAIESTGNTKAIEEAEQKIKDLDATIKALGGSGQSAGTGISQGLGSAETQAAALLRQFESFRSSAYWDVNAFRVGYGSSTTTGAGGAVGTVGAGTTVTREEAEQDLARRVVEFQTQAAAQIGPAWANLANNVKAAITSVTYNYGHVPGSVVAAAQGGGDVAGAIGALGSNPGRRAQEAAYAASGGGGSAASPESAAAGTADQGANNALLQQAIEARTQEVAKLAELKTAQAGLTETQKADLAVAQAGVSTRQNEVNVAQQKLAAARTDLQTQQGLGASQEVIFARTKAVADAQTALTAATNQQAEAQARLSASQAAVAARASGDIAAQRNAELALAAVKLKEAGDDPARQAAAGEEIIAINARYNEAVLAQTTQTQDAIVKKAEETAASQKSALDAQLKEHAISEQSWLSQSIAALNTEKSAVSAAFDAEIAAAQNDYSRRTALETQKVAALASIDKQIQVDQQQAAEKYAALWQSATQGFVSDLDAQIGPLLNRTETLRQALGKVIISMTEQLAKFGLNTILTGNSTLGIGGILGGGGAGIGGGVSALTAALGLNTVAQTAGNAAQAASTAASITGTTANVAGTASNDALAAATLPNTAATLANTVATQFAAIGHFFGFATGTPFVPETTLAVVHKGEQIIPAGLNPLNPANRIGSFETGAWSVPPDQLAYVQSRGQVVPSAARGSAALAAGATGGPGSLRGGGAVHIHPTTNFNISANDGASVEAWARNNSDVLSRAMEQAARHGAFLGTRRLSGT